MAALADFAFIYMLNVITSSFLNYQSLQKEEEFQIDAEMNRISYTEEAEQSLNSSLLEEDVISGPDNPGSLVSGKDQFSNESGDLFVLLAGARQNKSVGNDSSSRNNSAVLQLRAQAYGLPDESFNYVDALFVRKPSFK